MARFVLPLLLLLASCGEPPTPWDPARMTAANREQLGKHASAATWEDLDATHPGHRLRDPRSGIVFVRIPAGEFAMGSDTVPQERPRHTVKLTRDYLLAETELTIAQWQQCVRDFAGDAAVPVPEGPGELPFPLSMVDAERLAACLGYRLPTECEWERACCGGLSLEQEPWLDEAGMREAAWFHRNSDLQSHPVRQKAPNPYGLYDTLGNLWEWCADNFDPGAYEKHGAAAVDPRAPANGSHRVLRGGSWFSIPPATPRTRTAAEIRERSPFFGVRFACDAPPLR